MQGKNLALRQYVLYPLATRNIKKYVRLQGFKYSLNSCAMYIKYQ